MATFVKTRTAARRFLVSTAILMVILIFGGCGTTTKRIGTEQLLMSDAVDRAIGKIDFSRLQDQKVYLDTEYIHSLKGIGFVNSDYVISSLRQQLTAARCLIQEKAEDADIVVEPRIGALGADGNEVVYGIPQSGNLSVAAAALSNSPVPTIPEISVGKNNAQTGIAKVMVFAYNRHTREPVWQSGVAKAESTSKDTWLLGAGPFQRGSIYRGIRFAGDRINRSGHRGGVPDDTAPRISLQSPYSFPETETNVLSGKTGAPQLAKPSDGPAKKSSSPVKPAIFEEPAD